MRKRLTAALLCLYLLFTLLPATAFAEGEPDSGPPPAQSALCEHHPSHDAVCGYVPAIEGTLCTFVCEVCNAQDSGDTAAPSDAQPATALTAMPSGQVIYVGNVQISSTGYWTTDDNGNVTAYSGTGTPTDNYIYYNADTNTLTLHNATIKTSNNDMIVGGAAIGVANGSGEAALTIQLKGSNTVSASTGIYVYSSSGAATLTITGSGSLDASGGSNGILVQSNSGVATLTIQSTDVEAKVAMANGDGVKVRAGGSSNAFLTVAGGSLTATWYRH